MMVNIMALSSMLVPFFMGLVLLIFFRGEDRHMQLILSAVSLAFSLFLTLFTMMLHAPPVTFCIDWLASAGQMCITLTPSSLILVFISAFPLVISLFFIHKNESSAKQSGLVLIAFSAMQIAFSSDHFMLRYVALEFVGLCITAAALLFSSPIKKRWAHTKQIFLNLRIGDLALLVAIFLMFTISQSFRITDNFNDALTVETNLQVILSVCLLVAIWVKLAVWPLGQWRLATASIKGGVLTWVFELAAPLLGIYLLYRSAPLFGQIQPILFPAVLAVALIAQMITLIISRRKRVNDEQMFPASQLAAVILVLSSFWISQKTTWAYMLFWVLLKVAYSLYNQLSIRKRSKSLEMFLSVVVQSFLPLGFSFFLVWALSVSETLPTVISFVVWSLWSLQVSFSVRDWNRNFQLSTADNGGGSAPNALKQTLIQSIKGLFILFLSILLAVLIADLVRGSGYRLFTSGMVLSSFPLLSIQFWVSLIIGLILSELIERIAFIHMPFKRLRRSLVAISQRSHAVAERDDSDPLDFYEKFNQFFQQSARFVYKHFEEESTVKIGGAIKKFFQFLFKTVEGFSSGELWNRSLQTVVNTSRNLQQMHHGILRFNLLWLLVFIISISLFVWFGFIKGWI